MSTKSVHIFFNVLANVMQGLGTDHAISGPMRVLEKNLPLMAQTDTQTHRRTNIVTLRLNQPNGPI